MCQKLPEDFKQKVKRLQVFVKKEIENYGITDSHIINMDEVPVMFDIPIESTVAQEGVKVVTISTAGLE